MIEVVAKAISDPVDFDAKINGIGALDRNLEDPKALLAEMPLEKVVSLLLKWEDVRDEKETHTRKREKCQIVNSKFEIRNSASIENRASPLSFAFFFG